MSKALTRGPFDESPIELGHVVLKHHEAVISPKATDDELQDALRFATAAADSSPYWVGDLVAFVEDDATRAERESQILGETGMAQQTLANLASVSRRVLGPERALAPSIGHAETVAKMAKRDQRTWLSKARTEGWNVREFRLEVKAAEKRGTLVDPGAIKGKHRVWLIDYPWIYNDGMPSTSRASRHYPGLGLTSGLEWASGIERHSTKDAVAFWWVTAPMLYYASEPEKGPDPYRLILASGFEPKTGGVWDKVKHGFGNYLSIRHEHLIIATRGSCTPDRPTPMIDSVITERSSEVHSEKPASVAKLIERLYDGPYIECFARSKRKGWTVWGNQTEKAATAS